MPYQRDVELVSDVANQMQEMNVILSHVNINKMEQLSARSVCLTIALNDYRWLSNMKCIIYVEYSSVVDSITCIVVVYRT